MNNIALYILIAVIAALVGFGIAWLLLRRIGDKKVSGAEDTARRLIAEAEKEAEIKKKEALLEAKEEWYGVKSNYERELQNKRNEIQKVDRKLDSLTKREKDFQNRERTLSGREKGIAFREQELEKLLHSQNEKLERIAGMTPEEAKQELKENLNRGGRDGQGDQRQGRARSRQGSQRNHNPGDLSLCR